MDHQKAVRGRELYTEVRRVPRKVGNQAAGTDPNTAVSLQKPVRLPSGQMQEFPVAAFAIIE